MTRRNASAISCIVGVIFGVIFGGVIFGGITGSGVIGVIVGGVIGGLLGGYLCSGMSLVIYLNRGRKEALGLAHGLSAASLLVSGLGLYSHGLDMPPVYRAVVGGLLALTAGIYIHSRATRG
ncbi:hypothetical protein AB0C84_44330 [Actinomadura sp. NPDC048955]|uniref:hypothetical protein n=1 Tax=Actinomadura sp. NPDC048955 TaxID=3158228 RepID=UPI003407E57B